MGSVYKLTDGEKVYYGSTIETLNSRLSKHRCVASNNCVSKYFNRDNLTIELVEEVEDEEQLLIREKYYIQNNECFNRRNPFMTITERKEQKRKYNSKPYHCPCGNTIQLVNKNRHEKSKYHIENCPII